MASTLNNLALLYQDQGEYAEAEPLFQRSLAIGESRPWVPSIPTWPLSLNNLAELFRDQGKFSMAEPLHQRSLAIREKALLVPSIPTWP